MARRRSWLRVARTAAVLLLAGAVVNVLVAWGCVLLAPPFVQLPAVADEWVTRDALCHRGGTPVEVFPRDASGLTEAVLIYARSPYSPDGNAKLLKWGVYWRAGWPCRALACVWLDDIKLVGGIGEQDWSASLTPVGGPYGSKRCFPLIPRWPGFAINTVLYAAVLASGFAGFRWWRSRRVHGRCKGCGYDLAGNVSGVCPECGERT